MRRASILAGFLVIAVLVCGWIGLARRTRPDAPLALAAASSAPRHVRLPILVYHHLRKNQGWAPSTWSFKMSVSPAGFEKQMQWLEDHGYTTIDLTTAAAILKGEREGPTKPVVITFDDNQLTQYTVGVPILVKHKQTAVFYLITDRLDNKSFITRDKVKDMVAKGMDIESHTLTHRVLTALPVAEIGREFTESKKILEELTGKPVLHLAYPGTAHNKTVRAVLAKTGYVTGTIMDPRPATEKDDLSKLPRIMMLDSTNLKKVLP